jgi:hypothetical protein
VLHPTCPPLGFTVTVTVTVTITITITDTITVSDTGLQVPSAPAGQDARAPTTWLMHAHRAATSWGSMAGNMAMRSWLRPSLR